MYVKRWGGPRMWSWSGRRSGRPTAERHREFVRKQVTYDGAGVREIAEEAIADRGFASAANRACLARGGEHYIHAEKLRNANAPIDGAGP
jgi:hypothetical protein